MIARSPIVFLVAFVLALSLASSARATGAYGVNDWRPIADIPDTALAALSQANIRVLRSNMYLQHAPARSTEPLVRDLSQLDAQVERLARHNLSWLPVLISDHGLGAAHAAPLVDPQRQEFAAFAAATAARYGPMGPTGGTFWRERGCTPAGCPAGLSYRPVELVEVWNEPNLPQFWPIDPADAGSVGTAIMTYRQLLAAVRGALRVAAPEVRVSTGGVSPSDLAYDPGSWIRRLSGHDAGACAYDAVAFHPYTKVAHPGEPSVRVGERFERLLDDFRGAVDAHAPDAPIHLTEFGWGVHPAAKQPSTWSYTAASEPKHAAYLREALGRIEANRAAWSLGVAAAFAHKDDRLPGSGGDRFHFAGLRRFDDSPRPAWGEFTAASSRATELPAPSRRCP